MSVYSLFYSLSLPIATDSSKGILRSELGMPQLCVLNIIMNFQSIGIVIGVVVVFFVIIAGVLLLLVALWACKN